MNSIGNYAFPIILIFILISGAVRLKGDIFGEFLEGAKQGLETVKSILPSLVGLITAVEMFKASGALNILTSSIKPLADLLHIPSDLLPLIIMRPISGSGAAAMLNSVLNSFGADTLIGRAASVICASGDTTLYATTLYFNSVGVKRVRHTLAAAFIADLVGVTVSIITVKLIM